MNQVIYHETQGMATDYGYGYKIVDSSEVPTYVAQGWYEKSIDVPTNIHRVAVEEEENQFIPKVETEPGPQDVVPEPSLKPELETKPETKPEATKAVAPKKKSGRPSKK